MRTDLPYILAAAVCAVGILWAASALHVLGAQPVQSCLILVGQAILLVVIVCLAILEIGAAIACIVNHRSGNRVRGA